MPTAEGTWPPTARISVQAREALTQKRNFYPSHGFMISAGTVTVDMETKQALLVFNKRQGVYQLPKGRKDIGEDLLTCAVRETLEETGVQATPLALKVATRATVAREEETVEDTDGSAYGNGDLLLGGAGGHGGDGGDGIVGEGLTMGRYNFEAAACCQYMDLKTMAMKMVFYYAATGDSRAEPKALEGPDEGLFENVWTDVEWAAERLTFKEDGQVVKKVLADMRRSGYDI
ncbi:hypothetical protein SODALDRAFT_329602 [Sodiomyces alkalinus F11]|uniref:Nudix hydrolase domain-containing protein n=1 Tax=Sodiomyces alkalinus (strain CBS 110278 / VKM F-3762 / F11) TaxID=1314773 RepID=A0A3N2PJM5_SODAK|nr:hypothetical protein SODALDRAFT_329602 [Sodiomyces alkalinus F11]ROT34731.1 hypothetical protein SODALDRAFT_329602 [Sodiomyces alkalinus F11]